MCTAAPRFPQLSHTALTSDSKWRNISMPPWRSCRRFPPPPSPESPFVERSILKQNIRSQWRKKSNKTFETIVMHIAVGADEDESRLFGTSAVKGYAIKSQSDGFISRLRFKFRMGAVSMLGIDKNARSSSRRFCRAFGLPTRRRWGWLILRSLRTRPAP